MRRFLGQSAALLLALGATSSVVLSQDHSEATEEESATDHEHDHGHHDHAGRPVSDPGMKTLDGLIRSRSSKRENVPTFRAQESLMRRMCALMEEDGRRAEWFAIVEKTIETPPEVKGVWKNLLKSWSSSCRPVTTRTAKVKKLSRKSEKTELPEESSEEVEAAPTAPAAKSPALTPGTELLELASEWSVSTSSSMGEMPQVAEAVKSMLQLLRPVQRSKKAPVVEMSPGARTYFDVLAEYLTAPWARMFAEEERKRRRQNADSSDLDDLFDDR